MRIFALAVLLVTFGVVGCERSGGLEEEEARLKTRALSAQVDVLQEENLRLEEEARLRGELLQEYTRLINKTLADLDALTEREGMLRRIRLDMEAHERDLTWEGMESIESRINDNIAAIERHLQENRRQRDELRRMMDSSATEIEGMRATIAQLNTLIERKEETIRALRREAELMLARIEELSRENVELVEENAALRQVYYIVDDIEGLMHKGIVDKVGGFLTVGRRTRIENLDDHYFITTTMDAEELYVGRTHREYEILSDHKVNTRLFAFERRADRIYLSIADPQEFWKVSRYLVIEAR